MKKETKTFYPGDFIVLKKACITGFRPLNDDTNCKAVECDIEERPFDTKYALKVIQTYTRRPDLRHSCFKQVLRKK